MNVDRIASIVIALTVSTSAMAETPEQAQARLQQARASMAKAERDGQIAQLKHDIGSSLAACGYSIRAIETDASPGMACVQGIDQARAQNTRLSTLDPLASSNIASDIDALESVIKQAIAKETACRATPQCMNERKKRDLIATICADIPLLRDNERALREERANPAGVVDLEVLHGLGASIQNFTREIDSAKREYAKVAKRPFAESMCQASTGASR